MCDRFANYYDTVSELIFLEKLIDYEFLKGSIETMKPPKILMVAPVFYPFPPVWPEGMVNAKLALAMKKAGWSIDVIVAGSPGAKNRYPSETNAWFEIVNHVHVINRTKASLMQKLLNTANGFLLTGRILRHLAWGTAVKQLVSQLTTKHPYDFILSRAIPDYAHFAAFMVHRQKGIPWIANWNDPVPNHKFPPPYGDGPFSPLKPDIRTWYQIVGQHASWHTFPCERLRKYMCSYLPGKIESRSSVIPHIAMDGFSASCELNHDGGFSMCYAGSVLPPRDVSVFLEGIKHFTTRLESLHDFHIRFMVDKPEMVAKNAEMLGLGSFIRLEPSVPYTQMPEALARANVLVIIEAPLDEGIFMPSKIVDYVQIGRPILAVAPAVGTMNDIFSGHRGGISVDCQSSEAVAQAVETLYNHWKAGSLDQEFGSATLMSHFSESKVLADYMALFEKITKTG